MKTASWVVLALGAALLGLSCSKGKSEAKSAEVQAAAAKQEPPAVSTATIETRNVERTIDVTGALHPDETVSVSTEVPGRVATIRFDFGQMVKKGDVIAELEKTEGQIQLDRTRAAIAQALARIGLTPSQDDTIPESTPAIRQARAQLEDAKSKYDNAKKLVESGDIARERFTELSKTLEARQAALDAAEHELRTQLANLQALRAEKRLAEKRLNDTTLRAPFDGQVAQRMVSPGQYIKENTPVVTLVKAWPLRLRLDVPETATAAVHLGDTLRFTTEALAGQTFTATVTQVNPSLDAQSRSLSAEARLNQSSPALRPGMFVQVRLTIARNFPITVIPRDAMYQVAGLTKLFVVNAGKTREVTFTPGQTGEGWVEVTGANVSPGEMVATSNLSNLTGGLEIRTK